MNEEVTITLMEYNALIDMRTRLQILADMERNLDYVPNDVERTILFGVKEKEEE